MVAPCTRSGCVPDFDMSRDLDRFFHEQKRAKPPRQDRLTGGTGLYMNYSITFTEISFYPETSILLQIIQIIHMTFRMMPKYDRKGRASAGAGSGATIIRPPTDKELGFTCVKSKWVLQDTPHF